MFKLIALAGLSLDVDPPSGYDDPAMICYREPMFSMWFWNPGTRQWFRDTLGYPVWFRTPLNYGTWSLESHGWKTDTETLLFQIAFPQTIGWKVVEMSPIEIALVAHNNVDYDPSEENWRALFDAMGNLGMKVDDPTTVIRVPVSLQSLRHKPPLTQTVSILADLINKGKEPPQSAIGESVQARLVWGLMSILRDPA